MGKTIEETALGILEIMTGNMVRAIRNLSVERGHDPRNYTLVAFGGAGGLHGHDVATALGMSEVLVPLAPGIVCAQGLTSADLQESFVLSGLLACSEQTAGELRDRLMALGRQAAAWFETERTPAVNRRIDYSLDIRFRGQNYELSIPVGSGSGDGSDDIVPIAVILGRFFAAHERSYGFANREARVEVVSCRATARAALGAPRPFRASTATKRQAVPDGSRRISFVAGTAVETPFYRRERLRPGDVIAGPAVIDQMDATTVIFPADHARVDAFGNILITIGHADV
jgi:N-methylhydantoinase A